MNSKLPINSSTPANHENHKNYSDNTTFYPLLPNDPLVLGDDDIIRIARAVKATLREEIEELVAREVALSCRASQNQNKQIRRGKRQLFLQIDE